MAKNDKFYTKPEIAKSCVDFIKQYVNIDETLCLEPSAGAGVFLQFLSRYEAYDLFPESKEIVTKDFLTFTSDYKHYTTIGNPPFGSRSALAISFFNKAAEYSDYIGFIVPVSFMKWSVQKELNANFALLDYLYLPINSFTDGGKDFSIRTIFQVWSRKELAHTNKRLLAMPPISHPDFKIWQYNATESAFNTVNEDWTIATYRQGYNDYNTLFNHSQIEEIKARMSGAITGGKQQFFFIKPLTEQASRIITGMDFNALAERNTTTPGFGKGDFVSYYLELLNTQV